MKEAKLKKWKAKRDRFYARHNLALPQDVTSVQKAVARAVEKRGHKVYRNDRPRCDRFLKKLFKKYRLKGTTSEEFWYGSMICQLIGPPLAVRKVVKVLEKHYVRPKEKSRKKKKWRKP